MTKALFNFHLSLKPIIEVRNVTRKREGRGWGMWGSLTSTAFGEKDTHNYRNGKEGRAPGKRGKESEWLFECVFLMCVCLEVCVCVIVY